MLLQPIPAMFVLGMFTSDGSLQPSNRKKIAWGILQSSIALVLLSSGGLNGMQTASIAVALPFAIILVGICVSLHKSLNEEDQAKKHRDRQFRQQVDKWMQAEGLNLDPQIDRF